jgi:hypothetical protein
MLQVVIYLVLQRAQGGLTAFIFNNIAGVIGAGNFLFGVALGDMEIQESLELEY